MAIDKTHWRYFLALEADFANAARYVDFHRENFRTFSIEFMRIILAAASQSDLLMQKICATYSPLPERPNIFDYRQRLTTKFPRLVQVRIWLPRYEIWVMPWAQWGLTPPETPDWWNAYNAVKHRPESSLTSANLLNCIGAMAGLFSLVLTSHAIAGTLSALDNTGAELFQPDQSPGYLLVNGYALPEISDALK